MTRSTGAVPAAPGSQGWSAPIRTPVVFGRHGDLSAASDAFYDVLVKVESAYHEPAGSRKVLTAAEGAATVRPSPVTRNLSPSTMRAGPHPGVGADRLLRPLGVDPARWARSRREHRPADRARDGLTPRELGPDARRRRAMREHGGGVRQWPTARGAGGQMRAHAPGHRAFDDVPCSGERHPAPLGRSSPGLGELGTVVERVSGEPHSGERMKSSRQAERSESGRLACSHDPSAAAHTTRIPCFC